MEQISQISQIKAEHIADYLRLDDYDKNELETLIVIAVGYIINYTGLSKSEIDKHSDFIIVVYILCQDMYDNRSLYISNGKASVNRVITNILGMHRINLL